MECLQTLNVNLFGKTCTAADAEHFPQKVLFLQLTALRQILLKRFVLLFGSFSLQAQHTNTMTGQFKT